MTFLFRTLILIYTDNNNKQTMQLITNKYQIQLISSLIINNLHYNFIILNNKLIFTHHITNKNLKDINKLLKTKYNNQYIITN